MTKAIARMEEVTKQIDTIVDECMPITAKQAQGFGEALVLAKGVKTLREIFLQNKEVKEMVNAMKDTPLGFMTDRSPAALAASKKKLDPYTDQEIAECCIEGMMQGYRITGNEFNVIAGRFYPAKNGKYRKIVENPKISNFKFTTTSPVFETENRVAYGKPQPVQVAKVQCFASWNQAGGIVKLGYGDDKLIFKIKVNAFMGDDGVVGKALSKLFSRVLMRIDGNIIPESTDLDEQPEIVENEPDLADKMKNVTPAENPLHQTAAWKEWVSIRDQFPDITQNWADPINEAQCMDAIKELGTTIDKMNQS